MKYLKLLLALLPLAACSTESYLDNDSIMKSIDSMPITKTVYAVETDSLGQPLDTLSTTVYKYEDPDVMRYSEKKRFDDNTTVTTVSYFHTDGDLFYRETQATNGYHTIFKTTKMEGGEVEHAEEISSMPDESTEKINMEYTYSYHPNNQVKEMTIKTNLDTPGTPVGLSKTTYDSSGRQLGEYMIFFGDTINQTRFQYQDTLLTKVIYSSKMRYGNNERQEQFYDDQQNLVQETRYSEKDGELSKIRVLEHQYNSNGERTMTIEHDLRTNQRQYIEYHIELH